MLAWYFGHTKPESGKQPRSRSTAYAPQIRLFDKYQYLIVNPPPLLFNDLSQPAGHTVGQLTKKIRGHCIPRPLNSLAKLWKTQGLNIELIEEVVFCAFWCAAVSDCRPIIA